MDKSLSFSENIARLKADITNLGADANAKAIEETATRLERLNYAPPVIIPIARFLRLTKETLLTEIDNILALSDEQACALAPDDPLKCQDMRLQSLAVQIFYYKKLVLLRQDDIETWEEIDELYVHD